MYLKGGKQRSQSSPTAEDKKSLKRLVERSLHANTKINDMEAL